jgi:hypothetical protein
MPVARKPYGRQFTAKAAASEKSSLHDPETGALSADFRNVAGRSKRIRRIVCMIRVAWSDVGSFIISRRLGC